MIPSVLIPFLRRCLSLAIFFSACLSWSSGQSQFQFDEANRLYEQGNYLQAVRAYEKLLNQGVHSASIFFNLGNAYFKAGQMGMAIIHYRHAQEIAPRDSEIKANLDFTRNRVLGGKAGALAGWRKSRWLSFNELTLLTLSLTWGFAGLLTLQTYRPHLKLKLRPWTVLLGCLFFISTTCLALRYQQDYRTQHAVVAKREGFVRRGPFDESPAIFTAPDGTEFKVLDQKSSWLKVDDQAGHRGWMQTNEIVIFQPLKQPTPPIARSRE